MNIWQEMVVILIVLLSLSWTVSAFLQSSAPSHFTSTTTISPTKSLLFSSNIHSTDSSNDDESQIIKARDEFVALSQTLATRSSAGKVFISSMKDAVKFRDEFVRFESKVADCLSSSSSLPLAYTSKRDLMLGDWTFIATASVTPRLFTTRTAHDADEMRATTMSTKELKYLLITLVKDKVKYKKIPTTLT